MERNRRGPGDTGGDAAAVGAGANPGKATLTEVMRVSRKAGDGDGIQSDAAELVSRAGSSGGEPLPSALRSKFESSLGADLGGVRVHTGEASTSAAAAVSARAFAFGQDIHFNQGQYAPQSAEGERLIAHEVAHTVQQSGVARRAQFKLEVSSPVDSAEVDADRAADAMVHGARASVMSGSGVARKVFRTPAGDMAHAADAAEAQTGAAQQAIPHSSVITNIGDVNQATGTRNEIVGYRANMSAGVSAGEGFVTSEQNAANEAAIVVLDQYIGDAHTQGSSLGDFQIQAQRLERDYARLMGEIQAYAATPQGHGTNDSSDPAAVAQAQIASTGRTTAQLQSDFRSATTSNGGSGNTATHQEHARQFQAAMQTESQNVGRTQALSVAAEQRARSATEHLHGVLTQQQVGAQQGQIAALTAAAASAKEEITLIGGFVKTATGLGVAAATGGALAGPAVTGAVSTAVDIANYAASHAYDGDISRIQQGLRSLTNEVARSAVTEAATAAAAAKGEYIAACQAYVNANQNLQTAQANYRQAMQQMGAAADAASGGGHQRFEILAQLLGEADTYLSQSAATLAIGQTEMQNAADATHSAAAVNNVTDGHSQGTTYYRPYQSYHRQTLSYAATQMSFRLYLGSSDGHTGSAEGAHNGVNPVMQRAITDLTAERDQITQHANTLRQVFNTTAH